MSIRLPLRIDEHFDPDDPTIVITRLLVWVSFLTVDGELTHPELAIVDTGAPLSLIPKDIWQDCRYLKLRNVPLLLGFGGLLDRADVYFSIEKGNAYLEI